MLSLDTHICVFAFEGTLRRDEEAILHQDRWGISAMVLWELAMLFRAGRIHQSLEDPEFRRFLSAIRIWPLSVEVALATLRLDFSSDSADEIIAATSLVHGAPLLTRDDRILRSNITPLAIR